MRRIVVSIQNGLLAEGLTEMLKRPANLSHTVLQSIKRNARFLLVWPAARILC